MKLSFFEENSELKCIYQYDFWNKNQKNDEDIRLKNTFYLKSTNYINDKDEQRLIFSMGYKYDNFYILYNDVFDIESNMKVYIDEKLLPKLREKHFIFCKRKSMIKTLEKQVTGNIYIIESLYDHNLEFKNVIEWEEYEDLIKKLPSQHAEKLFLESLVDDIFGIYFEMKKDYKEKFEKYKRKKLNLIIDSKNKNIFNIKEDQKIIKNELEKYELLLEKLKFLLKNEKNELVWQKQILDILLLIFPNYRYAINEVGIENKKRIDFILIDYFNNIDIIEIKSPAKSILSKNKYRENHVISREFSGGIMQIEKYLYYLNKKNLENCDKILNKLKEQNIKIDNLEINNPKGIFIIGRTKDFDKSQKRDYRIIKNKYANIINILSYDELIEILEKIIEKLSENKLTNYISIEKVSEK